MKIIEQNTKNLALQALMKAIGKFCIRWGVSFQEASEALKVSLVESADEEISSQDSSNSSRISIITGIHRSEVSRIKAILSGDTNSSKAKTSSDFLTKLIGQWKTDKKFTEQPIDENSKGKNISTPRKLTIEGMDSEFSTLVRTINTDVNPYTVLKELERLQLIEVVNGKARLIANEYVPKGNFKDKSYMFSDDVSDLISAIEENIIEEKTPQNLHLKTSYDNIPDDFINELKTKFIEIGARIHKEIRELLSSYDKDINKDIAEKKGKNRVVFETFSLTRSLEPVAKLETLRKRGRKSADKKN